MFRQEPGIKVFPACGHIVAMRGSFAWDYGTGSARTRVRTLADGTRTITAATTCPNPTATGACPIHGSHDIHGDRGAQLYAVEDAEVLSRNRTQDSDGGYIIKLQALQPGPRGRPRIYIYSHMDEPGFFGSGEMVRAGDTVGLMGDTGNARGRGVHLHFQALELINGRMTPVDVFDELMEALQIQEGVSPSGQVVALQGMAFLKGANVNRQEGDYVSCLVHPPVGGGGGGGGGLLALVAIAAVGAGAYYYARR